MHTRIAYLSQIIEKIGTPLLISILDTTAKDKAGKNPENLKDEAQRLAELLSKTVMLSIDLGNIIEIEKSTPEFTDSLRVAMAALASPLIASQYSALSKPPSEADLKKLSGALGAVMTFSDNFSPSPENAQRLNLLNANGVPSDAHQVTIQYLQAFIPVADAIANFSFGQSEKMMMQEAADRINNRAGEMLVYLFEDSIDPEQRKLTGLAFVKTLADLYSHCYKNEIELMANQPPDTSPDAHAKRIQTIWDNFEIRTAMLESLAANMIGRAPRAPKEQPAPQPEAQHPTPQPAPDTAPQVSPQSFVEPITSAPTPAPAQMPQEMPLENVSPASAPEALSESPTAAPPAPANPMAMFAKPKQDDAPFASHSPSAEQAPPPQESVPNTVQNQAPVQSPAQNPIQAIIQTHTQTHGEGQGAGQEPLQMQGQVQESAQTPPAQNIAQESVQNTVYQQPAPLPAQQPEQPPEQQAPANPMAFFKTPPKDEQTE